MGKYGKLRKFKFSVNFWIFALYGSWEVRNSFKMLSQGVGTFSTIEDSILGTFMLLTFFDPPTAPQELLGPSILLDLLAKFSEIWGPGDINMFAR